MLLTLCSTTRAKTNENEQFSIMWNNDTNRLSVSLQNTPIKEVITAIANRTGIHIDFNDNNNKTITKFFNNLPLELAIRRLVRPRNIIVVYSTNNSQPDQKKFIERIIIIGNDINLANNGNHTNIDKIEIIATDDKQIFLEEYLSSIQITDVQKRIDKIIEFVEKNKENSYYILAGILSKDNNSEVKVAIIELIGDMENKLGVPILMKAIADPDYDVRSAAITALSYIGTPEIIPALEIALKDSNEDIRNQAEALINDFSN